MVTLTEKGCHGINTAAESRGHKLFAMVGQSAHKDCREKFTNKRDIALYLKRKSANVTPKKTKKKILRSTETLFDYREQCLFCGKREEDGSKKEESG